MKKVFICSPYKGATSSATKQKRLARVFCRKAWEVGYFPIAPHLYLPQFLDVWYVKERKTASNISLKAIEACAEMWVFGENFTKEMREAITQAEALKIPITYFDEYGELL